MMRWSAVVLAAVALMRAADSQLASRMFFSNTLSVNHTLPVGDQFLESDFIWVTSEKGAYNLTVLNSAGNVIVHARYDRQNVELAELTVYRYNCTDAWSRSEAFLYGHEKDRKNWRLNDASPVWIQTGRYNGYEGQGAKVSFMQLRPSNDSSDLRMRLENHKIHIHMWGNQMWTIHADHDVDSPDKYCFTGNNNSAERVSTIIAKADYRFTRVSVERTMYPVPYIYRFNDYPMADGDIVHINGFFPKSLVIMFFTGDIGTSLNLTMTYEKHGNRKYVVEFYHPDGTNTKKKGSTPHPPAPYDWIDIFFTRYEYTFHVWTESVYGPEYLTFTDTFFWGPCTKLIIDGEETILQYIRSTRDKHSGNIGRQGKLFNKLPEKFRNRLFRKYG